MKVLILASEMAPFVKSGGLGDIIGSLPQALSKKGVDVSVFIPKYNSIKQEFLEECTYVCSTTVYIGDTPRNASIYKLTQNNVTMYFVENEHFFNRYGIYGFEDDLERFVFFNKAVLCSLEILELKPDIIHLNDWQTGITALYLKSIYNHYPFYKDIKTLFTIHNIQYQGVFPESKYYALGVNHDFWHSEGIEFYNNINLLKAGLVYSDAISTVSKTYSKEIMTPAYGYGLDGVIRNRANDVYGILNGVDYDELEEVSRNMLSIQPDSDFFEVKARNKRDLQRSLGLPERDVPMYAVISRLAEQKGLDLISDYILQKDIQFVLLGTGDGYLEHKFSQYQESYPDKVRSCITFNVELSYKIYSSADFFIMPSLFEPCGLGQILAMYFGTVPIVRNTGGLADTVQHFNVENRTGNGFVFNDFLQSGLDWAVDESLRVYYDKDAFRCVVENAKNSDFSWDKSANEYIELYNKIINK